MPARLLTLFLLLLFFSAPAYSQRGRGSGPSVGGSRSSTGTTPSLGNASPTGPDSLFLSGKVVLDDGSELTEPVAIRTSCPSHGTDQWRTETYTDIHGGFSFQFGGSADGAFNDASSASAGSATAQTNVQDTSGCQLQAVLPGFTSDVIELSRRISTTESTDLGRLTLRRLQHVDGTSISATSAQAPSGAKKNFLKGREEEQKQQWDDAEKSFSKAVAAYPKYAIAWFELGKLQLRRKDVTAAKASLQHAIAADEKYVDPYLGLSQIAMNAREWKEAVDTTGKLIALNPINFPVAYYFNGVANYYLKDLDAAEQITRKGVAVDETHQVPKLQFLLAVLLEQKKEFQEASDHLQQYLKMPLTPFDAQQGREELAKVAKLSANVVAAPASAK